MSASTNTIAGNPRSKHLIISTEFKIVVCFSSNILGSLVVGHPRAVVRNDVERFVNMLMDAAGNKGLKLPKPGFLFNFIQILLCAQT